LGLNKKIMAYIVICLFIIVVIIAYIISDRIKNKTKVVQRLEPQANNLMRVFTEVYYKGDLVKKWSFDCKFSKVEKRAEEENLEGKALIKIYKKFRN